MSLDDLKNFCRVAGLDLRTSRRYPDKKMTAWCYKNERLCFALRGTLEEIVEHTLEVLPYHAN